MKTEKIYTQHEENQKWAGSLQFYKDEMGIMKKRIAEIAAKNTSKDILAQVEHFQNQLRIQADNLDVLKHEVNLSNDAISKEIGMNDIALDRRKMEDHAATRERMQGFEKIFNELRGELNHFLSKTM